MDPLKETLKDWFLPVYNVTKSLFGQQIDLGESSSEFCFLEVFDIPVSAASRDHTRTADCNVFGKKVRHKSDLSVSLDDLHRQQTDVIRIYVDELANEENKRLQGHLQKQYQLPHYDKPNSCYGAGFKAIVGQFRQTNPNEWFLLKGYHFAEFTSFVSTINPWSSAEVTDASSIDTSEAFTSALGHPDLHWAQVMKRLSMQEAEDGRLAVFISCKTLLRHGQPLDQAEHPFWLAELFVSELLRLDSLYLPIRNKENWRKVFLLQYLHTNMNLFSDFLDIFIRDYVEPRRPDFDPRISRLRRWVLDEITKDAYHYQQLINVGHELAEMLESLIDVVRAPGGGIDDEVETLFLALEPELRACCRDTKGRLSRLADDMSNNIKYLDLDRNLGQTKNVQLLTILATLSLPLSLSAGVLSMSSRFVDLGVLIYDLFGVACLIGTVAFIIITLMSWYDSVTESVTRFHGKIINTLRVQLILEAIEILLGAYVLVLGALILASFATGLFSSVVVGAKILGYGLAIMIGGPVMLYILFFVVGLSMVFLRRILLFLKDITSSWKDKRAEINQIDPESGPAGGSETRHEGGDSGNIGERGGLPNHTPTT